jgi:hypothetical protein
MEARILVAIYTVTNAAKAAMQDSVGHHDTRSASARDTQYIRAYSYFLLPH